MDEIGNGHKSAVSFLVYKINFEEKVKKLFIKDNR